MSAYTPGPWEADGVIVNAADSTVAMCADRYEALTDEHLANARLIAAAPDLLAALQECARAIRQECDGDEDHQAHPIIAAHMKTLERAAAAIAKARGEA